MRFGISSILFYTGPAAAQVQLPVGSDLLTELTKDITQLAEDGVEALESLVASDNAVVAQKPPTLTAAKKNPVKVQAVHALASNLTALPTAITGN